VCYTVFLLFVTASLAPDRPSQYAEHAARSAVWALKAHPEVERADAALKYGYYGATPGITVTVELRPGTAPDRVTAITRDAADRLRHDQLTGRLVVGPTAAKRVGAAPGRLTLGLPAPAPDVVDGALGLWLDVSTRHRDVDVSVWRNEDGSVGRETVVRLPAGVLPEQIGETFRALAVGPRPASAPARWTLLVGDGRVRFGSDVDAQPEPVLQAIESLRPVTGTVGPEDTVRVGWVAPPSAPPYLEVVAELRFAPTSAVHPSSVLAQALRERLDGSGLPYVLRVGVSRERPFVDVDGR
jgi:hypothetical protein